MKEITLVRFKGGAEVILYSRMEMETDDIKKKIYKLIGDEEQNINLKEITIDNTSFPNGIEIYGVTINKWN